MKFSRNNLKLYAVTDQAWTEKQSLQEQVELALKGGITCLQLREKNFSEDQFLEEAFCIKSLCMKYDVPFIVNDNVDVTLKCNAAGVHLGQQDMKATEARKKIPDNMILGVSASNLYEAKEAENQGADYLGVGAIFPTSTKKDADLVSIETLYQICNNVDIPVVAIGGINADNMHKLKDIDIAGVALVSEIFSAKNIEEKCKFIRALAEELFK